MAAPAPILPAGPRSRLGKRSTSQAQLSVGVPALRRDHPDAWTLAVLNAVLGDGMSSRLFLSVREARGLAYDVSSGLIDYADAGALEVSAGVDPAELGPALDAILAELARLRDELVPDGELEKAKRYLAGGMELRMDDTRHVASWIGGQEALHDRVLDLDEALAAVDARRRGRDPARGAGPVPRRGTAPCGRRPGALPARPGVAPATARMTTDAIREPDRQRRPNAARRTWNSPASTSASGRSRSPGPSSRRWPGAGRSTTRRRWTSPRCAGGPATRSVAGEAAATALEHGVEAPLALIITAEAAVAIGRPGEARRLATKAMSAAGGTLDALFAGMPRSARLAARTRPTRRHSPRRCSARIEPEPAASATSARPAVDGRARQRPARHGPRGGQRRDRGRRLRGASG